jgi:hypothetical protein
MPVKHLMLLKILRLEALLLNNYQSGMANATLVAFSKIIEGMTS